MEPLWEAVFRLERMRLAVLTLHVMVLQPIEGCGSYVADTCDELQHKIPNVFNPGYFCDPPHLLKTTRNSWYNKHRHLWVRVVTRIYRLHINVPFDHSV